MFRLILTLFGFSLLTGCAAGLDEDFSCDKVGGVKGCTSMNEVRDNIHAYTTTGNSYTTKTIVQESPPAFAVLPRRDRFGHPSRTQDNVKKITIFPFESHSKEHYIDTLDIYFILDESKWSGKPVQSIKKD